jgi:dinuclear metal center YbgI/SA1388 family protein
MPARVKDILNTLNTEAPFSLAEAWDNVGLLVGSPEQEVTAVLAGLDPTNALLDEAIALGANTVITHHPVIFKPLPAIDTTAPYGRLLEKALTNRIAIIACHTNYDNAEEGVSTILARQLGLDNLLPLIPAGEGGAGLGRIGTFPAPLSAADFLARVLDVLGLDSVQTAGTLPTRITTVAVCGGSGSEFAEQARRSGADVYLSAEIKHNIAVWAGETGFCIIDGTHYATEKPAIAALVSHLEQINLREGWNIRTMQTKTEHHPFVALNRKHKE